SELVEGSIDDPIGGLPRAQPQHNLRVGEVHRVAQELRRAVVAGGSPRDWAPRWVGRDTGDQPAAGTDSAEEGDAPTGSLNGQCPLKAVGDRVAPRAACST